MSRRARAKRIAAIACSAFIGVMEFVAWGMMLGNTGSKLLAVYGLENLKFFTVLSRTCCSASSRSCTLRSSLRPWCAGDERKA